MKLFSAAVTNVRTWWGDSALRWALGFRAEYADRTTSEPGEEPPERPGAEPTYGIPLITAREILPRGRVRTVVFLLKGGRLEQQEGDVFDPRAACSWYQTMFEDMFLKRLRRLRETRRQSRIDLQLLLSRQVDGSLLSTIISDRARIFTAQTVPLL